MNKKIWSFVIVITLLCSVSVISAVTGSVKIGVGEFLTALWNGDSEKLAVIKDLRFPRIIVALFAGAALSVSGVLLQAVMRNPLADAGVIGISSGAGFVSVFIVTVFPGLFFWSPLLAFLGGVLACFLVFSLSWKSGLSPLKIILVGIAINAMFTGLRDAFITICSYIQVNVEGSMTSNLMMKTWSDVELIVVWAGMGLIVSIFLYSWCNVLVLQDKTAKNLGVRVNQTRIIVAAVAVLLAAISTVVAGVIAFVGLLVPHIARRLVGSDHKLLIPFSALAGALLILSADTLGRTLIAPMEIPASTLMAIIGGPFLIFLLRKE